MSDAKEFDAFVYDSAGNRIDFGDMDYAMLFECLDVTGRQYSLVYKISTEAHDYEDISQETFEEMEMREWDVTRMVIYPIEITKLFPDKPPEKYYDSRIVLETDNLKLVSNESGFFLQTKKQGLLPMERTAISEGVAKSISQFFSWPL